MEKISTIPEWGTWWFAVAMSWNPTSKLKKINKTVGWSDEWILEDENTPKKESYKKGFEEGIASVFELKLFANIGRPTIRIIDCHFFPWIRSVAIILSSFLYPNCVQYCIQERWAALKVERVKGIEPST